MCIENTLFKHKRIHTYTWTSADSRTKNQIDYILINQKWRSSLLDVKTRRGANIGSDHELLTGKLRLKFNVHKQSKKRRLNLTKLSDEKVREQYQKCLADKLSTLDPNHSIEQHTTYIEKSLLIAAEKTIGFVKSSTDEWISADTQFLLEKWKKAKEIMQLSGKQQDKILYRRLIRKVQQSFKSDRSKWVDKKATELEIAAKNYNTKLTFKLTSTLSQKRIGALLQQ